MVGVCPGCERRSYSVAQSELTTKGALWNIVVHKFKLGVPHGDWKLFLKEEGGLVPLEPDDSNSLDLDERKFIYVYKKRMGDDEWAPESRY